MFDLGWDAFVAVRSLKYDHYRLWSKGHKTGRRARHTRSIPLQGGRSARECEFERLYMESYGLVYGYVRARMSCDADAEDVADDGLACI